MQEFCLARDVLCICATAVFYPNFTVLLRTLIARIEYCDDTFYHLEPTLKLFEMRRALQPWANQPGSLTEYCCHNLETSRSASTIQKTCQYLFYILSWTRSRETSLELDLVYSVLGVVQRLLGPYVSEFTIIPPLPNRPIADVFIWAASCILENSPDLNMLSSVEPRKATKCLGLPSWVPDFSAPLGYLHRILDWMGTDAMLVDMTRARHPGLVLQGNLLKVSERKSDKYATALIHFRVSR